MLRVARFRRSKNPPPTGLEALSRPEEPPAAAVLLPWPEPPAGTPEVVIAVTFRVGDYEVGSGFCARLCGHPGIRY